MRESRSESNGIAGLQGVRIPIKIDVDFSGYDDSEFFASMMEGRCTCVVTGRTGNPLRF